MKNLQPHWQWKLSCKTDWSSSLKHFLKLMYYSPRWYSIPKFPPERTMVNVLLHWCCAAQINSSHKIRPLWLYEMVYSVNLGLWNITCGGLGISNHYLETLLYISYMTYMNSRWNFFYFSAAQLPLVYQRHSSAVSTDRNELSALPPRLRPIPPVPSLAPLTVTWLEIMLTRWGTHKRPNFVLFDKKYCICILIHCCRCFIFASHLVPIQV